MRVEQPLQTLMTESAFFLRDTMFPQVYKGFVQVNPNFTDIKKGHCRDDSGLFS